MGEVMAQECPLSGVTVSKATSTFRIRKSVARGLLLATTCMTPLTVAAQVLPTGGVVSSGSASIDTPSTGTMQVTQTTDRAILTWDSFSVGNGGAVTFVQPSETSAILNRVGGTDLSQINGTVSANGEVFLVNRNGIVVGPNGQVDTGAFVASTLDISNSDFNAGRLQFSGDGASASVVNKGTITVQTGSYTALLGGKVSNVGHIVAPLGRVGLGSGERVTLDFSGDGFLQVALPSDVDGEDALIKNAGRIEAEGGLITMQAATAKDAVRRAINLTGVAEARSVSGRSGKIVLGGGAGGRVEVRGKVTTAPKVAKPTGTPWPSGSIDVIGAEIVLIAAELDASGQGDGGTIRVGGDHLGLGDLLTAATLRVDADSVIKADSYHVGRGGDVTLWADNSTFFYGEISATGGQGGGDGGFIEVSAREDLRFAGLADASAVEGTSGEVFLDPGDVSIIQDGFDLGTNDIYASTVEAQLELADFTISTLDYGGESEFLIEDDDAIYVEAGVMWDANTALTLIADGNIYINAPISAYDSNTESSGGELYLYAGEDITTNGQGSINVDNFYLGSGNWSQTSNLPGFFAYDFQIESGATFTRAQDGTGTEADPYEIVDVYGLQGIATDLDGHYELADNIDASGSYYWNYDYASDATSFYYEEYGFEQIGYESAFTGSLDGNGYAISGLEQAGYEVGLFNTIGAGGEVRNLSLTNVELYGGLAGGLATTNAGTITDVSVSGTVSSDCGCVGGLVDYNEGVIQSSRFDGDVYSDSYSGNVGGLVGVNLGTIDDSISTGTVTALGGDVGGLVGLNGDYEVVTNSEITNSRSSSSISVLDGYDVGGLVGGNLGSIERSGSYGSITGSAYSVGGLVGYSDGDITDSKSETSIDVSEGYDVGGLVGYAGGGTIERTLAAGTMTVSGYETSGGLVGYSDGEINNSFWDVATTGQGSATGVGSTESTFGLTTEQLQNTQGFIDLAAPLGWDFANVWAPPSPEYYPELYALENVVYVQPDDVTAVFGQVGDEPLTGSVYGGASVTVTYDSDGYPDGDAGEYDITANVSGAPENYRIVTGTGTLTIQQAAEIVISLLDVSKQYGTEYEPTSIDVAGITLTTDSDGYVIDADTGTYVIVPVINENALAFLELNYEGYSIQTGTATVTPAPAPVVTLIDRSKDYGTEYTPTDADYEVSGLLFEDESLGVSLSSDGYSELAGAGLYDIGAIVTQEPGSQGLNNYETPIVIPAEFEVEGAGTLTFTALSDTKEYGETYAFENLLGEDFVVSGLVGGDTAIVELASDGATATANVDDYGITFATLRIVNVEGETVTENYEGISEVDGVLSVTPVTLALTPIDQSKVYGEAVTLDGSEYALSGDLKNNDTITFVDLQSDGELATANVVEGGYDITVEQVLINGAESENYVLTLNQGTFDVIARDLTIIPVERVTKTYGDEEVLSDDINKNPDTDYVLLGDLQNGDEITVDLFSTGEAADADVLAQHTIAVQSYDLTAIDGETDVSGNYNVVEETGEIVIQTREITVIASDVAKTVGSEVALTEYEVEFDRPDFEDRDVESLLTDFKLISEGTFETAEAGTYGIETDAEIGNPSGNYEVVFVPGTLTVNAVDPEGETLGRIERPGTDIPNPNDTIITVGNPGFASPEVLPAVLSDESVDLEVAEAALVEISRTSGAVQETVDACRQSEQQIEDFLACVAQALEVFSQDIAAIQAGVPAEMSGVAEILAQLSANVQAAEVSARIRLATATTDAERNAIRQEALSQAVASINSAELAISQLVGLVRAEDPELEQIYQANTAAILTAVGGVGAAMSRSMDL